MLFDLNPKKEQSLFRERVLRVANACDFSSNDYLNLTSDPRVSAGFQYGFSHYPAGSGGSLLVGGYHDTHHQLEQAFIEALQVDQAVLFTSGYVANLGIMALLAESHLMAVFDKALHASFYDGIKLSGTAYQRFPHQAYGVLKEKLSLIKQPSILITESVYSMGGHFTPLDALARLHPASLIVDEAHAFGLYGPEGLGAVLHFDLTQADVPLRIIPFGKALGGQGAIVVGQQKWIEALIQVARGVIYSTGLSPAYAYGLNEAFKLVRQADEARANLFSNVRYFRRLIQTSALTWGDSNTPIQHLHLGCSQQALACANRLSERGVFCRAIRPPTVSAKEAGLRVVLNANHTHSQMDKLMELIEHG